MPSSGKPGKRNAQADGYDSKKTNDKETVRTMPQQTRKEHPYKNHHKPIHKNNTQKRPTKKLWNTPQKTPPRVI